MYCIVLFAIWQYTIKITTVQTFSYFHKMYRHSVPVKRWWPLNWQIMSQPECHNFKICYKPQTILLQTRFPSKIESRFVKTRQFLFSLEMYSSMPTKEAEEPGRLRGRQTAHPPALALE